MLTQSLISISLIGTEWILYVLVLMSIVSWAISIEKFIFLRKKRGNVPALEEQAQALLKQGNIVRLQEFLKEDGSSPATVAAKMVSYLDTRWNKGTSTEEYLGVVLSQEKLQLETRISFLGTMVSIAPFVGLLGTVLGIINAFHGLSVNKQGGELVMAGIAEALVATALGLFIAIPAAAFYNYFIRSIKKIIVASENLAHSLMMSSAR